jgi:hypothetical protein
LLPRDKVEWLRRQVSIAIPLHVFRQFGTIKEGDSKPPSVTEYVLGKQRESFPNNCSIAQWLYEENPHPFQIEGESHPTEECRITLAIVCSVEAQAGRKVVDEFSHSI